MRLRSRIARPAFAGLLLLGPPSEAARPAADVRQAERMLALLRAAASGTLPPEALSSVLECHGTDLILQQQNISRRVSREQYRRVLEALPRAEAPALEPVDGSERSRRGVEGLRKDVWPSLVWGLSHTDLLGERLNALEKADLRPRALATARRFLPDGTAPEVRISIVMGGRAGAAALSGGEIYFDVLTASFRAAAGGAGAYPTPEEQVEFFAHEIHHVGLTRLLERERRGWHPEPAEARGLDFVTSLVMEGGATYLINGHQDLDALRRDPSYGPLLARGDGLLSTCQDILREVLEPSLDADGYDRATAPLSGNGWHSAGAMMLAPVDRAGGLDAVLEVLRDPRRLLVAFNRAAGSRGKRGAWRFDPELAARVKRLGGASR